VRLVAPTLVTSGSAAGSPTDLISALGDHQVDGVGGRDRVRGLHVQGDLGGPVALVGVRRVEDRLAAGVADVEFRRRQAERGVLNGEVLRDRRVTEGVDDDDGFARTGQMRRNLVGGGKRNAARTRCPRTLPWAGSRARPPRLPGERPPSPGETARLHSSHGMVGHPMMAEIEDRFVLIR